MKRSSDPGRHHLQSLDQSVWQSTAAFNGAAWAIFKSLSWWVPALAASAVMGFATALTYLLAVQEEQGIANVASNVAIHGIGSLLILLAVTVLQVRHTLIQRL